MASEEIQKEAEAQRELNKVMQFLGHTHSEGNVRGGHLYTILDYLININEEDYNKTLAKLRTKVLIQRRYVKEYLDSLEAWEIIIVSSGGGSGKKWRWKGI